MYTLQVHSAVRGYLHPVLRLKRIKTAFFLAQLRFGALPLHLPVGRRRHSHLLFKQLGEHKRILIAAGLSDAFYGQVGDGEQLFRAVMR